MKNTLDPILSAADMLAFIAMCWRLFILACAGIVGIWCALACVIYFHYVLDDLPGGIACASGCMAAGFLMFKEALS